VDNVAYIALSMKMVQQRALSVAANNIANSDTAGFKVEELMQGTQAGAPARDEGVPGAAQFVINTGLARNFSQGEVRQTGAPLDLAISGSGYFRISTPQGEQYTRDGRFSVDAQDRLVTAQGNPVLDDAGGQIVLDPQLPTPTISRDGVVSQGNQRVARIGVVDFPSASVLSKQGDNLFANTSNAQPAPAANAQLHQGMIEGSNVNPVVEMTNLIQISRAYEDASQMVSNIQTLSEQTVNRLGKVSGGTA
jgi:flagellar basal-body rod protein FlgF